jgi:hypothetical protein
MGDRKEINFKSFAFPTLFVLGLILTNPDKAELHKQLLKGSKNYLWSLSRFFGTNIRSLVLGEETYYNLLIFSISKAGSNAYHVGIAGIWVESSFWTSIPGCFVILQLIWHTITSFKLMCYRWLDFIICTLWFIMLSRQVDAKFQVEKFTSTFFLVASLLTWGIAHLILFPTKLFSKAHTHPGSMLYGTASAVLVFLTMSQDKIGFSVTFRWLEYNVNFSQVCLLILVFQMLLGHSIGFAGSLAGSVLFYLVTFGILDERKW